MAIFGNINDLKETLFKDKLEFIFNYFEDCLDSSSSTYQRLNKLPLGSFEKHIINKDVFALEQVFKTKNRKDCFFESHQRYIDFQLVLSGNELMELSHPSGMIIDNRYDIKKDLTTYKFSNNTSKLLMKKGDLAIYFPNDVHMGLGYYKQQLVFKKTVIKFPIDLWNI